VEQRHFGLPKFPERKQFFLRFGKKKAEWTDDVDLEWLSSESEDMSGADIVELIRLAKEQAYYASSFVGDKLLLTRAHFVRSFELLRASGHWRSRSTKSKERLLIDAFLGLKVMP
jgi:SpoVK/Ycf46/Vps4 family AAA+-type ATPase